MYRILTILMSVFISFSVVAHGGHDHSHPSAFLTHFLFWSSIALAVVATAVFLVSRQQKHARGNIK